MKPDNGKIIRILDEIAQGASLTKAIARDLEVEILATYPDADDDNLFENVLHMLASYEPDGGEYLYNEEQLTEECKRVLIRLRG
jgi:hypothetical protein